MVKKNNVYLTIGEKKIIQIGIGFIYQYMKQDKVGFNKFLVEHGYAKVVTKKKIKVLLKKIPIT